MSPVAKNFFSYITKYVTEPLIKYEINDYNNVTLDMGGSNKREYFPGPRG